MQDVKDRARMLAASMVPAPRAVKRLPDRPRAAETLRREALQDAARRLRASHAVSRRFPALPSSALSLLAQLRLQRLVEHSTVASELCARMGSGVDLGEFADCDLGVDLGRLEALKA